MKALALALSLLLCLPAEGAPLIRFAAAVDGETLAEDAILVLHCVSTRAGLPWEFAGEASGSHWLRATEKKGKAELTWHRPEGERTALLSPGGSEEACDALEPSLAPAAKPAPAPPPPSEPTLTGAAASFEEEESGGHRAWLWAGLGLAVVGGFFLWKSNQPDHRGVEMR